MALKAIDIMIHKKARKDYEKKVAEAVEKANREGREFFDIVGEAHKRIQEIMKENNLTIADLKKMRK